MSTMRYLPPLRRLVLPAAAFFTLAAFCRLSLRLPSSIPSFVFHQPPPPPEGIHVSIAELNLHSLPIANASENHLSPPKHYYYNPNVWADHKTVNGMIAGSGWRHPISNPSLDILWKCHTRPNKYTDHIRLPNFVQNISQVPIDSPMLETRTFWNPTIIALPYWSKNQYLLVSRIVTNGLHQENVICEANVCYTRLGESPRRGEEPCTEDDIKYVGPAGGMRCASSPVGLSVPPTPAKRCVGRFGSYTDIPGFHDPRIFWSGKGEPLMMVNTQSRYACFGLWLIDLRSLYSTLSSLLTSSPRFPSLDPLKSYPALTELTRNPPSSRSPMEKNWMFFYPSTGESFIHYDISDPRTPEKGRTFAKELGGGLTTTNLTDPLELPCIPDIAGNVPDLAKKHGHWHQATNSLRLVLCKRGDESCHSTADNTVFVAVVHRKHANALKLPLRYERYFIVWATIPPFGMLGISQHPILMANETASGWSMDRNWDNDPVNAKVIADQTSSNPNSTNLPVGKGYWANFTYTVSIAWAWGRGGDVEPQDMNVGYLDDEVILGIGIDDRAQGFSRVKAADLVQCMRACPGRSQ